MKKKIALMANGWNGENLDNFIQGLRDVYGNGIADTFVFASHASYAMNPAVRRADNSIYMLPDYSFFDAVILFGSGMNSEESIEQIIAKCQEAKVPLILQGTDRDGLSSVTVNNYAGMRSLCDHLIEQHQVKSVKFIGGPKENEDSNLRKKALIDALEAHGYSLDDGDIVYANWERSMVQRFITDHYSHGEKLPDAFVCANDILALFTLLALESIGIYAPEEVLVTGFDNLSEGNVFCPSLASVDQRYREQGKVCAELVLSLIEIPDRIVNKVIPCTAEPGESCGCFHCKNEDALCRALAHDVMRNKFDGDRFRSRQSRMEMCIMSSPEYKDIPVRIQKEFFEFFYSSDDWDYNFQICVHPSYKELAFMDTKYVAFGDENFSPIMDVLASRTNGVVNPEKTVKTADLLVRYDSNGRGDVYIFSPLKVGESVVGYLVLGHKKNSFSSNRYFEFGVTVSTALEKYQSNIKMIHLNEKLAELMEKDSLTSVKNRIAYDSYMKKMGQIHMDDRKDGIAIVVCDINNLKNVNDCWGHDAGDVYIQNCCKLMEEIFHHSSIFRTGGDEFVILIGAEDYSDRYELLGAMRMRMEELAVSEDSPLEKVSIATGLSDYDPTADQSLIDVVKRADAIMYVNKAEMKARA